MRRSLSFYWRSHLALALAAATTTAVLTGALVMGDSVRGSLRALALERLGRIESALVSPRALRRELASELGADVVPAYLSPGSVEHAATGARAARVSIVGVDDGFGTLFPSETLDFTRREGQIAPSVVLNESLARELGAAVGHELLLRLPRPAEIPRETLVGRAEADETLATLRLAVTAIVADRGLGAFSLAPAGPVPRNAFVELPRLARALGATGRANAFLSPSAGAAALNESLAARVTADDLGLIVRTGVGATAVESRQMVVGPELQVGLEDAARDLGFTTRPVLTYLANEMRVGERRLPYSTVAGLDLAESADTDVGRDAKIFLNAWAAEDLAANIGDSLTLTYFEVGPRDELRTREAVFTVAGIVPVEGIAADRTLTPDFPGVSGADDMSDWDPSFPVDLSRIRPRDEEYWDLHGATPKAFVPYETARELWQSRFGAATSLRLTQPPESRPTSVSADSSISPLASQLSRRLSPSLAGLTFRPVRAEAERAATGATDFAGLFLGFSFFLIGAAALLAGLLFRLAVERRAKEAGLLLAVGFPLRQVRRRFLSEGFLVAGVGVLLGLPAAVGYAGLLVRGLSTWWRGAIGETRLGLDVVPGTLALGAVCALLVVGFAIWRALARLSRVRVPALLAGAGGDDETGRDARRARRVALVAGLVAVGSAVAAAFVPPEAQPGMAFGTGAAALVAGLAGFLAALRGGRARRANALGRASGLRALVTLGQRAAQRRPGRSLAAVALVAAAVFVLVAVAANRGGGAVDPDDRGSGTGGFRLLAESAVPLLVDLGTPAGRAELGLGTEVEGLMAGVEVVPLRLQPGEDASCLNLFQPGQPRVLGVPRQLVERGGFGFQATTVPAENPWSLLGTGADPKVAAFGDAHSVQWILHSGLGKTVNLPDGRGEPAELELVGLLARSVFQSELLVAEADFERLFPDRSGYSVFLIRVPAERAAVLSTALENGLGRFGFDVTTTEQKLAEFKAVEDTYLSTFATLGGLGLLLGTLGLGVVLSQSILERRGELAALRAFGFPRRRLAAAVVVENLVLVVFGLALGTGAGLLAVAPHLLSHGSAIDWVTLVGTLAVVLLVGLVASVEAVRRALRVELLPALRER
ncbi:MAG: ABC transporter permease [Thermoanaerobaculia bacterium]|nr:ABC transporter permease [Thermoanaerobaculia bacterium]